MSDQDGLKRELGVWTATLVVVASMIGAGIFGNTGIIQAEVGHPLVVLSLWFIGGLIALAGALCYAELATIMPQAGGEYVYMRKIFGPMPSFLTGWVSFIVGFAAPAASAALLSGDYLYEFFQILAPATPLTDFLSNVWARKLFAVLLVLFFALFHIFGVRKGSALQNTLTIVKIFLVGGFAIMGILIGLAYAEGRLPGFENLFQSSAPADAVNGVSWGGVGIGLLFVMFAYSGWNGAAYLAEEIRNPEKNLPRALFWGTLFTVILYMMLNFVYYLAVPVKDLHGHEAVAALATFNLFGGHISLLFNAAFMLVLFTSVSVSVMIGPRVYYAMARDYLFFKSAAKLHPRFGTPVVSILLQTALSMLYIITGSYDQILAYMGFALAIFPIITVYGLIVHRKRYPDIERPYRTRFFPLLPIFFILLSFAIMITSFMGRPVESSIALIVVLLGIPIYWFWFRMVQPRSAG